MCKPASVHWKILTKLVLQLKLVSHLNSLDVNNFSFLLSSCFLSFTQTGEDFQIRFFCHLVIISKQKFCSITILFAVVCFFFLQERSLSAVNSSIVKAVSESCHAEIPERFRDFQHLVKLPGPCSDDGACRIVQSSYPVLVPKASANAFHGCVTDKLRSMCVAKQIISVTALNTATEISTRWSSSRTY